MPRADEPRITIRLSRVDHAILEEAARIRGVRPASLLRGIGMEGARRVVETETPRRSRPPEAFFEPSPAESRVHRGRVVRVDRPSPALIVDDEEVAEAMEPPIQEPRPIEIPKEGPDRAAFFRDLTSRGKR